MTSIIPKCEACRADAKALSPQEIADFAAALPTWQVVEVEGIDQLHRSYRFRNFAEALALTNRIGALAERFDHHPEIVTEWGRVTVKWWSHKIKGLHELDFALARHCDELASDPDGEK